MRSIQEPQEREKVFQLPGKKGSVRFRKSVRQVDCFHGCVEDGRWKMVSFQFHVLEAERMEGAGDDGTGGEVWFEGRGGSWEVCAYVCLLLGCK